MDKSISTLFFILISFRLFSQSPVTVVIRDPSWTLEDQAKFEADQMDKLKQYAELQQQTLMAQEHLHYIKEATKKLREINRKVANYRQLEDVLVYTYNAYDRLAKFTEYMAKTQAFSPTELKTIISSLQSCLSMTTRSIDAITVVVTDNFGEMDDSDRMFNLRASIAQLQSDLGIFYNMMQEVEMLNNQRMAIRTFKAVQNVINN